jgi:hypothetical protein
MLYSSKGLKPLGAVVAAAALLLVLMGAPAVAASPETEQLIVFVQPGIYEVDRVV